MMKKLKRKSCLDIIRSRGLILAGVVFVYKSIMISM